MFWFWAFLSSYLSFCLVCHFSWLLLGLRFFLLLDDLLELFLTFGLLVVLHCVLDSRFKFYAFVINWLIKGEIEKPSGQYLSLICDESLTCRDLNSNLRHFGSFIFIFISFGESCLLVSWCAGGRCSMAGSDDDHDRSRRPGVEDRKWSHKSDTR
jgi:hypothetical protein